MATSSLEVSDAKQNHSACRVRGNRTPPSQDQRSDRSPGPTATRQPGRTADPLRQHWLPLPRPPAAPPRALPDLDPQGRQQNRHPHPGRHPSRRPAPADGQLPPTTRTHHRTRDPCAPAGQKRPDPARPLTGLSARSNLPSLFLRGPLLPFGGLGDGPHLGYDVLAERRALAGVERSDWACELTHHRVAVVAKPHGRVRRATSPAVPLGPRV